MKADLALAISPSWTEMTNIVISRDVSMQQVQIAEAKAHLSALIDRVQAGEEIVIALTKKRPGVAEKL